MSFPSDGFFERLAKNSATTIPITQILQVIWHPMLRKALVSRLGESQRGAVLLSSKVSSHETIVGDLATTSAKGFSK